MSRFARFLYRYFSDNDQPADAYLVVRERATEIKDFVFAVIEGCILLGALRFGASQHDSILVWTMYFVVFGAILLYVMTTTNYLLRLFVEELLKDRWRQALLVVTHALNLVITYMPSTRYPKLWSR